MYGYDTEGNWVSYRDKAGRSDTVAYDDAGQPLTADTRGGEQLTMGWENGRVARVTGPDTWVEYRYDDLGRVTQVANPETTIELVWEADDDLESIVSDGWAFGPLVQQYAWTDAGRYAGSSSRFGDVTQSYDHLGRPAVLSDPYTGDVSYGYDGEGRLESVDRSTGLSTTFGYTDTGRLASIDTELAGDVLEATRFAWDVNGRIEAVTDAEGDHAYTWDAAGRLLSADHPLGSVLSDEAYDYDANGNRTAWDGNADAQVTTNAQDQLLTDAAFSYDYDLDGRLEAKTELATSDATTYDWNSFGQLVRIGYADLTETTFRYDGLGRRIEVNHRGEVRRFVWDLGVQRAVLDANDDLVTWSSTDPWGALLAEWDAVANTSEEALSNHLMTVTGVVDAAGNAVRVPRDSFGNAPGGPSGDYEPYAVTWHGMDPSGLVYARGRYLDPTTGRFISEDPRPAANLYTYAGNNPLTAWDPSGAMIAIEYGFQTSQSDAATTESSTQVGIRISCMLMTDAGAISLLTANPLAEIAVEAACTVAQGRGRPPCMRCFTAGTTVLTERGPVAIENIESGDLVVARAEGLGPWERIEDASAGYPHADDMVARLGSAGPVERVGDLGPGVTFVFEDGVFQTDATGERIRWTGEVLAPVGDTMRRVARVRLELDVAYDDGHVGTITATPEHPFFVAGEGWVPLGELVKGDVLAVEGGRTAVVVRLTDVEGGYVYNFEVLRLHNYYVDDGVVVHNTCRPPNLSPPGAGRRGAFREARRRSGIPMSQQPNRVRPNIDRRGNVQPGRVYEYRTPDNRPIQIREDAGGHYFGPNDPQNRGPHFNDPSGGHYDF